MNRRYSTSPTLSPALTGGDDQPRGNCHGLAARMAPDPTPFDVLTEKSEGPRYAAAKREILSERLCGGCPLRDVSCWPDAHKSGQPWFRSLRGKSVSERPRPELPNRSNANHYHRELAAARLADLRVLAAAGATLEEVCDKLGANRDALYKWCRANGHLDLWRRINPPKPRAITARRDPRRKVAA